MGLPRLLPLRRRHGRVGRRQQRVGRRHARQRRDRRRDPLRQRHGRRGAGRAGQRAVARGRVGALLARGGGRAGDELFAVRRRQHRRELERRRAAPVRGVHERRAVRHVGLPRLPLQRRRRARGRRALQPHRPVPRHGDDQPVRLGEPGRQRDQRRPARPHDRAGQSLRARLGEPRLEQHVRPHRLRLRRDPPQRHQQRDGRDDHGGRVPRRRDRRRPAARPEGARRRRPVGGAGDREILQSVRRRAGHPRPRRPDRGAGDDERRRRRDGPLDAHGREPRHRRRADGLRRRGEPRRPGLRAAGDRQRRVGVVVHGRRRAARRRRLLLPRRRRQRRRAVARDGGRRGAKVGGGGAQVAGRQRLRPARPLPRPEPDPVAELRPAAARDATGGAGGERRGAGQAARGEQLRLRRAGGRDDRALRRVGRGGWGNRFRRRRQRGGGVGGGGPRRLRRHRVAQRRGEHRRRHVQRRRAAEGRRVRLGGREDLRQRRGDRLGPGPQQQRRELLREHAEGHLRQRRRGHPRRRGRRRVDLRGAGPFVRRRVTVLQRRVPRRDLGPRRLDARADVRRRDRRRGGGAVGERGVAGP